MAMIEMIRRSDYTLVCFPGHVSDGCAQIFEPMLCLDTFIFNGREYSMTWDTPTHALGVAV